MNLKFGHNLIFTLVIENIKLQSNCYAAKRFSIIYLGVKK